MAKFTKKNFDGIVRRLKVPEGKGDVQQFDDGTAGFGVRRFKSGKATFFVKFSVGKRQRRMSLGPATAETLEAARTKAGLILQQAKTGDDAQAAKKAERAKTSSTLGGLIPRYLAAREDDMAPSYYLATERYLNGHWKPLHGFVVEELRRRDVVAVQDTIAQERGKTTADRAAAALSGFYAWAIERGYSEATPLLHVKKRANGGGRERVLSEDELVRVWRAVDDMRDYGQILRLLILTGQRKTEIGDLAWPEVDLDKKQIELPGGRSRRTKNRRGHVVPLSESALEILGGVPRQNRRDYLFGEGARGLQGWSRCKSRLDDKLPKRMAPWTVHDIRRSVVTHMNELGLAAPHTIEACVNHVSGHRANVAGVYNRASYSAEKRAALEAWGAHVMELVGG